MGIDWQAVLTTLGSTAVIVGGLAWVAKKATETWLERNLENHKRELERVAQRELEHLRLDLRLQEARQSRLLARQAAVIAGVYARLERLHSALVTLATPLQHSEENINELRLGAVNAFNEFGAYYLRRGIWLDEETCNAINELHAELTKLLHKFYYNADARGMPADRKLWIESFNKVKEDIPIARGLLDKRFRQLLGVAKDGAINPQE